MKAATNVLPKPSTVTAVDLLSKQPLSVVDLVHESRPTDSTVAGQAASRTIQQLPITGRFETGQGSGTSPRTNQSENSLRKKSEHPLDNIKEICSNTTPLDIQQATGEGIDEAMQGNINIDTTDLQDKGKNVDLSASSPGVCA